MFLLDGEVQYLEFFKAVNSTGETLVDAMAQIGKETKEKHSKRNLDIRKAHADAASAKKDKLTPRKEAERAQASMEMCPPGFTELKSEMGMVSDCAI